MSAEPSSSGHATTAATAAVAQSQLQVGTESWTMVGNNNIDAVFELRNSSQSFHDMIPLELYQTGGYKLIVTLGERSQQQGIVCTRLQVVLDDNGEEVLYNAFRIVEEAPVQELTGNVSMHKIKFLSTSYIAANKGKFRFLVTFMRTRNTVPPTLVALGSFTSAPFHVYSKRQHTKPTKERESNNSKPTSSDSEPIAKKSRIQ